MFFCFKNGSGSAFHSGADGRGRMLEHRHDEACHLQVIDEITPEFVISNGNKGHRIIIAITLAVAKAVQDTR